MSGEGKGRSEGCDVGVELWSGRCAVGGLECWMSRGKQISGKEQGGHGGGLPLKAMIQQS